MEKCESERSVVLSNPFNSNSLFNTLEKEIESLHAIFSWILTIKTLLVVEKFSLNLLK